MVGGAVLAAAFFLSGIENEPFADEYAYLTQAYFTDLLLAGKTNDPAWLEFPAYDLPPLPKYAIGLSLHAARLPILPRKTAVAWYRDINARFGNFRELAVARIPSALLGAVGCLALFRIGWLLKDRKAGWIAFFLLLINPLYGLHARRAMSDVPCEALILVSLAFGLVTWLNVARGRGASVLPWLWIGLSGVFAGLAVLCKFNGLLALMVLGGWALLGAALPGRGIAARASLLVGSLGATILAFATFVGLNPTMLAHPQGNLPDEMSLIERMNPWQRFRFQMKHRTTMSEGQQQHPILSHNALTTLSEKVKVIAVQGFGRFGPLGKQGWSSKEKTSERRYEWVQDWGAAVWGPMVLGGFLLACEWGRRQYQAGEIPTGWVAATWAIVTFGVVTVYIPMAWDRYLLPIQSVSCLLVALLLSNVWDLVLQRRPAANETGVPEA